MRAEHRQPTVRAPLAVRGPRDALTPGILSAPPHQCLNGPAIAKILIVDDDPSIRQLVGVIMTTEGYDVIEAEDGVEATEAFDADPEIDAIILDVMMPRLDGYGVLEHVRASSTNPDVAVVMLTAKGTQEDQAKAEAAGCDGYVTKPFDPDLLLRLIEVTLMYSPADRAATRQERDHEFLPEIGNDSSSSNG